MANELFVPSIILCLILAYLTGILTVVGVALLNRPAGVPYVIVLEAKEPTPATPAEPPPQRSQVIHEQQSQATFSGEQSVKTAVEENLAEAFTTLRYKAHDEALNG